MKKVHSFYEPYLKYLSDTRMSDKTITEHRRFLYGAIDKTVGDKWLFSLRINDAALVGKEAEKNGKYGTQRALVVYRRLLRFIHREGYKMSFYWKDVEVPYMAPIPVEYLDTQELQQLREAIPLNDRLHAGLRTRTIIELIIATGLRISEVCSLDISDINWGNKEMKVLNCKSDKVQTVYLTDESLRWIRMYLDSRTDKMPFLFVSGRGRLLPASAKGYLHSIKQKIGLNKRIYHHLLRKTFITHLVRNTDIKTAQKLARHEDPKTTLNHYTATDNMREKSEHLRIMKNL